MQNDVCLKPRGNSVWFISSSALTLASRYGTQAQKGGTTDSVKRKKKGKRKKKNAPLHLLRVRLLTSPLSLSNVTSNVNVRCGCRVSTAERRKGRYRGYIIIIWILSPHAHRVLFTKPKHWERTIISIMLKSSLDSWRAAPHTHARTHSTARVCAMQHNHPFSSLHTISFVFW